MSIISPAPDGTAPYSEDAETEASLLVTSALMDAPTAASASTINNMANILRMFACDFLIKKTDKNTKTDGNILKKGRKISRPTYLNMQYAN
jgi:hypothetical protein